MNEIISESDLIGLYWFLLVGTAVYRGKIPKCITSINLRKNLNNC